MPWARGLRGRELRDPGAGLSAGQMGRSRLEPFSRRDQPSGSRCPILAGVKLAPGAVWAWGGLQGERALAGRGGLRSRAGWQTLCGEAHGRPGREAQPSASWLAQMDWHRGQGPGQGQPRTNHAFCPIRPCGGDPVRPPPLPGSRSATPKAWGGRREGALHQELAFVFLQNEKIT